MQSIKQSSLPIELDKAPGTGKPRDILGERSVELRLEKSYNQAGAGEEHWVVRGNTRTMEIRRAKVTHTREQQYPYYSFPNHFPDMEHHQDPPLPHAKDLMEEESS